MIKIRKKKILLIFVAKKLIILFYPIDPMKNLSLSTNMNHRLKRLHPVITLTLILILALLNFNIQRHRDERVHHQSEYSNCQFLYNQLNHRHLMPAQPYVFEVSFVIQVIISVSIYSSAILPLHHQVHE